jgi:hypothetical protein
MKKFVALLVLSLISFPSWSETMDDLVFRGDDDRYYKKFSDVPFTGEIKSQTEKGWIREGKRDGHWVSYFKNGQLASKGDFKNGKFEGPWVFYFDDGTLWMKGTLKDGERQGRWVHYDGSKLDKLNSGVYKDGVKISD